MASIDAIWQSTLSRVWQYDTTITRDRECTCATAHVLNLEDNGATPQQSGTSTSPRHPNPIKAGVASKFWHIGAGCLLGLGPFGSYSVGFKFLFT